jgi:hypothetical protein
LSLLLVSLALHFVSIWVLSAVLRAAGVPARWLLAFGVVLALPPMVEPAAWVMTENLAQFGLAAGVGAFVFGQTSSRLSWVGIAGLVFGCTALTRPVYQLLAFALSAGMFVVSFAGDWPAAARRDARKAAAVLVLSSVVVLAGMSAFNGLKFGRFQVAPGAGFHLLTKTMTFIERLPPEYAAVREVLVRQRDQEITRRGGSHTGTQTVWQARAELLAVTGLSKWDLSSYLLRMNLVLIRRAPIEYLQEVARSMAVYWFPPPVPLASFDTSVLRWTWAALHLGIVACFFLQMVVLTGVAAFRFSARRRNDLASMPVPWRGVTSVQAWAYACAAVIVFYTMLLTCFIDIGDPRQRRPTDLLIVFLVVLGTWVWRRAVARARAPSSSFVQ